MISSITNTVFCSDLALFAVSRLGGVGRRRGSVDTAELLTWLVVAAVVVGGVSLALYAATRAAIAGGRTAMPRCSPGCAKPTNSISAPEACSRR